MSQPENGTFKRNRRHVLLAGAAGLSALGGTAGRKAVAASPAASSVAGKPVLTAPTTEGPYYFDAKKVRADITEGFRGIPLEVRFRVVDEAGAPLPSARVDIWHCDAAGVYSGYPGQGDDRTLDTSGKAFLRGTQHTDSGGIVSFRTIYPGWYRGRTTHIHFKVFNGGRAVLTRQFFLPDALSEFLYTQLPDYRRAPLRVTLNSNDGILIQAGNTVAGAVHETDDRYVATLDVAVDRALSGNTEGRPPAGPRRGPPPGASGRRGPSGRSVPEGDARVRALLPGKPTS